MTKIAFILAGCGSLDGSEIHEATCSLLAADQHQCDYACFALNKTQLVVINHLNKQPMQEQRNILVESGRIARGKVFALEQLQVDDYDILFLVGGFGAAQNNFSYYTDGANYQVDPAITKVVNDFAHARKPICAVCIAPLILAKTLKGVKLTLGNDSGVAKIVNENGNTHVETASGSICIDQEHKVITSPCYMLATNIKTIYDEVYQMIEAAKHMLA